MPSHTFDSAALSAELLHQNGILISKISTALECDESKVSVALGEVLRFMYLANKNKQGMLTPSVQVDLAWHEFILCTRTYASFCQQQFGEFIHHTPGGSKTTNQEQFVKTLNYYESTFGTPNKRYWGSILEVAATCGKCEAF